ncbi:hypothetical protein JT358_16535 [Micrococcales bacterium 31B]|nr:hypothetical protein [Micrococcales bacterium 31B]
MMGLFRRRKSTELDDARAQGDWQEVLVLCMQRGNELYAERDYTGALTHYGEARRAAEVLDFKSEMVDCAAAIARVNADLNQPAIAAAMYRQAREMARDMGRLMTAAELSLAAGAQLRRAGRSIEAVECFGTARTLFIQAGAEDYAVQCTREVASAYHDMKNYTKAIGAFDDAREWWEDLGKITLARDCDEAILRLRAESGR